jgi:hypothetical protein
MAVMIQQVLQDIDGLSLSDQMQVLEHLVQRVWRSVSGESLVEPPKQRKISDFRGAARTIPCWGKMLKRGYPGLGARDAIRAAINFRCPSDSRSTAGTHQDGFARSGDGD